MNSVVIETPLLDEIELANWFATKYNKGQMLEVETCIDNHVWITAQKIKIPVCEMETSHIKNCIRCWQGKGRLRIPIGYLGGKEKWLRIFNRELDNRQ